MVQLPYAKGLQAAAYFNTSNTLISGSGTVEDAVTAWLALVDTVRAKNLRDVSYDTGSNFADATTRETAAEGFASDIPILKNSQISFEMRWLPKQDKVLASPFEFTELLNLAWDQGTSMAMVFLDWPKDAADGGNPGNGFEVAPSGMASNWSVSLTKEEGLTDIQKSSVTLSVANRALWYTAAQIIGA